jgi:hypothetical protein
MANMRGRAPASPLQKAIAKRTITITQPWTKSTGPKSKAGKLRSSGKIHRWTYRDEFPSEGRYPSYSAKTYLREIKRMNACLHRHGLSPLVMYTATATYSGPKFRWNSHELGTMVVVFKLRCLEAYVPIISKHCHGPLSPKLPDEPLPRMVAKDLADAKVQTLAAVI